MPLPPVIAAHLVISATAAVTTGVVAARVYQNYSQRQARMQGYRPHESGEGFVVEVNGDEFWVSNRDIGPFQGIPSGAYVRYRVAPVRYQRMKIGWIEPTG